MPTFAAPPLLRSKLFWVSLLYFSEGFPLGLFFDLFPVYFRQQGVELNQIGLLSLLGLSWTLKFIWAPAIDFTRRHRWWMAAADVGMGLVMIVCAREAGFGPDDPADVTVGGEFVCRRDEGGGVESDLLAERLGGEAVARDGGGRGEEGRDGEEGGEERLQENLLSVREFLGWRLAESSRVLR